MASIFNIAQPQMESSWQLWMSGIAILLLFLAVVYLYIRS